MTLRRILLKAFQYGVLIVSLIPLVTFIGMFIHGVNLPYNEEGRYFDEAAAVVYHEQALVPYVMVILVNLIVVGVIIGWIFSNRKIAAEA